MCRKRNNGMGLLIFEIPKYGFPVDVVELQIYKEGIIDNSYDLSRDLKIAISEYAPDSEIIVDGNLSSSKANPFFMYSFKIPIAQIRNCVPRWDFTR